MAESLKKFDHLSDQMETLTSVVIGMNTRLEKVEGEIVKLNLISDENSRSLIKLADTYDRIARLEKAVFK